MSDEPKRLIPLSAPPGWGMIVIQNHADADVPPPPIVKYFRPPIEVIPGAGTPVVQVVDNLTES